MKNVQSTHCLCSCLTSSRLDEKISRMAELYALLAVLISASVGYYFTAGVLRLAQRRSARERGANRSSDESAKLVEDPAEPAPQEVKNTGDEAPTGIAHTAGKVDDGPDGETAKDALRGGLWIGILERSLITAFIILDFQAAIAVVIAIKGLGRYPELNAATSERFIIGTLASLAWASLCAVVALRLI